MSRYRDAREFPDDASGTVTVYACTHCGCIVWDRELHDQVNGLGLLDEANRVIQESLAKRQITEDDL